MAAPVHTDLLSELREQVLDTLKKAAIEGCVPADAHAGVCLGTYRPVTDSDTPDRKSRLLMDAKSPDGAAVFDYVIPNAPVHLVENTIVASQPRPGHRPTQVHEVIDLSD